MPLAIEDSHAQNHACFRLKQRPCNKAKHAQAQTSNNGQEQEHDVPFLGLLLFSNKCFFFNSVISLVFLIYFCLVVHYFCC